MPWLLWTTMYVCKKSNTLRCLIAELQDYRVVTGWGSGPIAGQKGAGTPGAARGAAPRLGGKGWEVQRTAHEQSPWQLGTGKEEKCLSTRFPNAEDLDPDCVRGEWGELLSLFPALSRAAGLEFLGPHTMEGSDRLRAPLRRRCRQLPGQEHSRRWAGRAQRAETRAGGP